MENIVLIGMPACGKSVSGVVLAKTLGMNFIDTDLLIQEKENRRLQQIINESGNDYFKKVEEEILTAVCTENAVISTGGSAIYYPEAMAHLKENSKAVYIKVPLVILENRLNNIKTRGVTMAKGETIADLYEQRVPLYEKYADITIEAERMTVEETVTAIVDALQSR